METVGIRELKQNASAVVARVAAGEALTVTRRGQPVARMVPLAKDRIRTLIDSGLARPARRSGADLPLPVSLGEDRPAPSKVLEEMREAERF